MDGTRIKEVLQLQGTGNQLLPHSTPFLGNLQDAPFQAGRYTHHSRLYPPVTLRPSFALKAHLQKACYVRNSRLYLSTIFSKYQTNEILSTSEKCLSCVYNGRLYCRAVAAIQISFSGIGFPFLSKAAFTFAQASAVTWSAFKTVHLNRKALICSMCFCSFAER